MNTVIYKPFKKKIDKWESDTSDIKENELGRKLINVKIGVQQIVDNDTGRVIEAIPVTEYMYEDICRNLFCNSEEYAARICLGYFPQVVVTYENRLVIHNEDVSEEVEKIQKVIKGYEKKSIAEVLVNSLLNYKTQVHISKEYRNLIKDIDEKCGNFYAPDFIGLVLREYFFETERGLSEYKEELHIMSPVELTQEIGKSLKEDNLEKLEIIKEELLYAFLLGDIITNPKAGSMYG